MKKIKLMYFMVIKETGEKLNNFFLKYTFFNL